MRTIHAVHAGRHYCIDRIYGAVWAGEKPLANEPWGSLQEPFDAVTEGRLPSPAPLDAAQAACLSLAPQDCRGRRKL
jgi:hypothetical protein